MAQGEGAAGEAGRAKEIILRDEFGGATRARKGFCATVECWPEEGRKRFSAHSSESSPSAKALADSRSSCLSFLQTESAFLFLSRIFRIAFSPFSSLVEGLFSRSVIFSSILVHEIRVFSAFAANAGET